MKLTAANVRTLPTPTDRTEAVFFDTDVKGFGLRVRPSGARSYIVAWKVKGLGGKSEHRRVTIGPISEITFADAKKRASAIKNDVRDGLDPANELKATKLETAQTFEATVAQFLDTLRARYRPRAFAEINRHLTKHATDLNKKPVARITRHDIAAIIEAVTANSGAVTGNRVRTSLSTFFAWCIQRGHAEINPVIGTEKNKEQTRERVLTPAELRLVWNAAGEDQYGAIIRLLMLTAQREAEIGSLRRDELHDGMIILPAERTKNGRPHVVPLSPLALGIIEAQEQRAGRDLIFGRGEGGFSGWSKSKERLDARIKAANGGKAIAHWTLHDLRRSASTYMAGDMAESNEAQFSRLSARDKEFARCLNVDPHIIEAVLNHKSALKGVARIYNRSSYSTAKRVALDQWATHLKLIVNSTAENVTPLRRAKA